MSSVWFTGFSLIRGPHFYIRTFLPLFLAFFLELTPEKQASFLYGHKICYVDINFFMWSQFFPSGHKNYHPDINLIIRTKPIPQQKNCR